MNIQKNKTNIKTLFLVMVLVSMPLTSLGQTSDPPAAEGAFTDLKAPEIPADLPWLNTKKALSLEALKGHVILVDFWTYCCINCMHILPDLAKLERKYATEPFVVLGVHSGKFDGEKDPQRIQEAIERYHIEHPVVVDSDFRVWRAWGVDAWPTLAVIDSEGFLVDAMSGEPSFEWLDKTVKKALDAGRERKTLAAKKLDIQKPERQDQPLSFPGKIIVAPDGRVFIADTGHHRIVISDADGNMLDIIGSGLMGAFDGPFETASMSDPQGMALDGDILYIADTNNHILRAADLKSRTIKTIAGTGQKGEGAQFGVTDPRAFHLRSPWDLELDGRTLYVAMAGSHQLWRMDLDKNTLELYAGTGRESIDNGPKDTASFSQPSGLALVGRVLYVADSETSAVRAVDLETGEVSTLVGKGLFDFGDVDGSGDAVRLQHVIGIERVDDVLYLADTYNHKIKKLDLKTLTVSTVVGGDKVELFEPSGLAHHNGILWLADTNNHRVRKLDLKTNTLSNFEIKQLSAPTLQGVSGRAVVAHNPEQMDATRQVEPLAVLGGGATQTSAPISVTGGITGEGFLIVSPVLPEGYEFTQGAPIRLQINTAEATGARTSQPDTVGIYQAATDFPIKLPLTIDKGAQGFVKIMLNFYYCSTGERKVCKPARLQFQLDVGAQVAGDGHEVVVIYRVPEAR